MAVQAAINATFADIHDVVGAVRSLTREGYRNVTFYGPVMESELEDALDKPPSPVRRYALLGGILGGLSGFALTLWSSYSYPLVVGGKPLSSIPAYVVISFECTILSAGICALIGMLIHNRMPTLALDPNFDPSFTEDTFGVRVVVSADRSSSVQELLRSGGSREVNVER